MCPHSLVPQWVKSGSQNYHSLFTLEVKALETLT